MSIEAMRQAMEALELLSRYENPNARIQVRKPKDGGPMVTIYPKRVAAEAATALRQAIAQAEQAQPVAHSLMCVCGAVWDIKDDGSEEMVHTPDAQPASKPVAWRWKERINGDFDSWVVTSSEPPPYAIEKRPLYTAPPQRKPLTDEQADELVRRFARYELLRAVEAAHGIKENT